MGEVGRPELAGILCSGELERPTFRSGTVAIADPPETSRRIWPVRKLSLFAALQAFRNQEVEPAATGVSIQFGLPAFLFVGVNSLRDLGEFLVAQFLNCPLDRRIAL
jgi:hypothetical protein